MGPRALLALLISATGVQSASAICNIAGPHYGLASDTVDWTLTIVSGQSCIQGLRLRTTAVDTVTVTDAARHGQVLVRGSGFEYRADPNFKGDDSFELALSGLNVKVPGNSTIRVRVYVR
jgi:hypothetical protein